MQPPFDDKQELADKLSRARERIRKLRKKERAERTPLPAYPHVSHSASKGLSFSRRPLSMIGCGLVSLGILMTAVSFLFALASVGAAGDFVSVEESESAFLFGVIVLFSIMAVAAGFCLGILVLTRKEGRGDVLPWLTIFGAFAYFFVVVCLIAFGLAMEKDSKTAERNFARFLHGLVADPLGPPSMPSPQRTPKPGRR